MPDTDDLVLTAHDPEYVAAVRRASADPSAAELRFGLGTDDDPPFAGMHGASSRVLAATVGCADAVWRGRADHAVNISGGLHHAVVDEPGDDLPLPATDSVIRRVLTSPGVLLFAGLTVVTLVAVTWVAPANSPAAPVTSTESPTAG